MVLWVLIYLIDTKQQATGEKYMERSFEKKRSCERVEVHIIEHTKLSYNYEIIIFCCTCTVIPWGPEFSSCPLIKFRCQPTDD